MSNGVKLGLVLLIILLIASGVFGILLFNEKTSLEQSNASLKSEVTQYKEKEKKISVENKKLEEQLKEAQASQEKIQKDYSEINARLNALTSERDEWKSKIEDLRKERNELTTKLQEKAAPLDELNGRVNALSLERSELKAKIEGLERDRNDWKAKVEALQSERDGLLAKGQIDPTAVSNDSEWKNKVAALERERDELLAKIQSLNEPASVAQQRSDLLAKQAANLPAPSDQEKYWANVLKEKSSLELKITDLEKRLNEDSVELADLKKKNSDLEIELNQLKSDRVDIDRRIKYNEELASNLSLELMREKNDKRQIADRVGKITEENTALRGQIRELTSAKLDLEKDIVKLTSEKESTSRKLALAENSLQERSMDVMDIKRSLEQKVQSTPKSSSAVKEVVSTKAPKTQMAQSESKEVELPPIIVSVPSRNEPPAPVKTIKKSTSEKTVVDKNTSSEKKKARDSLSVVQGSAADAVKGKVLSINKENNFVVVDIGEEQGLKPGDILNVFHGSRKVSPLVVIQVRKAICAADIQQADAKIEVGDSVTR